MVSTATLKTDATRKIKFLRIFAVFLLVITLCMTFTSLTPTAYADDDFVENDYSEELDSWEEMRDAIYDKLGGFGGVCWDIASTARGCNPNFNLSTIAGEIYKISNYSGKWAINGMTDVDISLVNCCKDMYEFMKVIGVALIFLFFLIDILDEVQADNFTIEHLIKKLITLTVAIVVMNVGAEIFEGICEFGDALIKDSKTAVAKGSMDDMQRLYEEIIGVADDSGFFSNVLAFIAMIGIIIENLIPYILTFVVYLLAYLVSFSRFIEILVRFAFAPIGISQLVSGGAKGPGMRYIKKFASVVLQGAVCVMAFGSIQIIQSCANEVNALFGSILLPITLLGFLFKVSKIADDIVGV